MEISVLGEEYETVQPMSEERVEESKNVLAHLGNKAGSVGVGSTQNFEEPPKLSTKLTSSGVLQF